MKLQRVIMLCSVALVTGLSQPAFAQGVLDDTLLNFHGVSALQALPRDQNPNSKGDLEMLRRLRDQLQVMPEPSTSALSEWARSEPSAATAWVIQLPQGIQRNSNLEFTDRLRPVDVFGGALAVPEPSSIALSLVGAAAFLFCRRSNRRTR